MKRARSLQPLTAIAVLAAASPGLAQAAQPGNEAQDVQSTLQQVVVTATKQGAENVQNVPMSISVVNTANLDREGVTSVGDFINSVPSVSMQQYGPGQNKFAIRGISDPGNIDPTNLVDQSLVSVYLDDTPISMQGATPDLRVVDLQRVEVIRGPQGTLYGASAMAGTIRLITQKPDASSLFGYAEGDGSYTDGGSGNWSARAMTNIPLIHDRLAVRLSGYGGRDSGWIDNIGLDEKGANSVDTAQFRAAGRLTINDRLTIDGSLTYARMETNGNNDAYSGLGPNTFATLTPEYYHDRLTISNITVNYSLGFADFVSSSSYTDRLILNRTDASLFDSYVLGLPTMPSWGVISNHVFDFVEEMRLNSRRTTPFNWIVGVYYDHSHRRYFQNNFFPGLDSIIGISSLAFDAPTPDDLFYGDQSLAQREIAGFGQITYTPVARLDLTAGARYFNYRQAYDLFFGGLAGSFAPGQPIVQNGRTPESGVNPRYVISYHVTPRSMVFVEAAKGYRYGGVNQPVPLSFCAAALAAQGLSGPAPVTFGPDQLWSYSLGEKSTVADGRATLNATAFYIDWRGMQTNDNLSCGYYFTQNAGHVTSRGAEFGARARLTNRFSISLNGSYTDAAAAAPIANLSAPEGAPVPYFPKYILNGSAQYTWPLAGERTLVMELDNQYRSATYNSFQPSIRREIPASDVVNAAITFMTGRWELGLYARNLGDRRVVTSIVTNTIGPVQPGDVYYYAPPRIVGLRARVTF